MASLWIVDRSPRRRASLARLANAPQSAVLGAPGDPRFESAPVPTVVLLALDGDWERELQFAHAVGERAAGARWILLGARGEEPAAQRLFDMRIAEFLVHPPPADVLRALIETAGVADSIPPLSERARRAAVSQRFAHWFEDLELPDVLRALDPRLADVPLLIRGEAGTGRGLVARYVHFFGGTGRGALAHLPCGSGTRASELLDTLAEVRATRPGLPALTIWLEGVEQLPWATQRELLTWLEFGAPGGAAGAPLVRWTATLGEAAQAELDPELRRALCGLSLRLSPLRERPHAIRRIATETARSWCARRQERPRRFAEDALAVLEEYPWPGNLRELEAVVVQSLSASSSDPLQADDLQLEGEAFAPLEPGEIGAILEEEDIAEPIASEPTEAEIDALLGEVGPQRIEARETAPGGMAERGATPPVAASEPPGEGVLSRLVTTLSHDVRNPLATIRTFAELLPERFDDPAFRDRFAESLSEDGGEVDALVERLAEVGNLERPRRDKVDVSALLEELLEQRRQKIRSQRLLVLKELDTNEPHALCDRDQLHFALDTLLGKAMDWVPTHGDVYLASRHHPAGSSGGPSVRVLVRFHDPGGDALPPRAAGVVEGSLELMIAELVVRAQGGTLSLASTEGEETVIVIDLPAP